MEALHDLVKSGKVRYLGASSMHAWQFSKALYLADLHGWTRFVSMQNHYNLLYREEEREMMPLCLSEGIGVIPWSPLARGRLARPWGAEGTKRFEDRGGRQEDCRPCGPDLGEAGSSPRTGRAGLAARQARSQRADRRRHPVASSPGRRCCARAALEPRRSGIARGTVQSASSCGLRLSRKSWR
jgi:aryl-alcohol dehydrogenase-like predicted oxidoreductase